jgi:3-oxoacyl-[acyl-carrier-protein] synthase-3
VRSAIIREVEYYLPESILTNDALAELYPNWPSAKILAKVGIRERRIAAVDECASDLAFAAAERLLARTSFSRGDVDFLMFCTQSPDYFLPTTACILQHRLGLPRTCAAFDFNLGCSGYVYGIGIAKALIESGQADDILVLAADTYSKHINACDKSVRTLFGDAGSATLVSAVNSEQRTGVLAVRYGTDGSGAGALIVPTGGMRRRRIDNAPLLEDDSGNRRTENDLFMDGAQVFAFTLREVPALLNTLLAQEGLRMQDIDMFVFHQANTFMLEHLRRKVGVPVEKFIVDMEDCGNTVSSTIPIALSRAIRADRIRPGMLVVMIGFGVGLSWAGAIVRWE